MTLQDKVIAGLEKTAGSCGQTLTIELVKYDGVWAIKFIAGKASVWTRMSTFIQAPKVVMDPFVEECIKHYT